MMAVLEIHFVRLHVNKKNRNESKRYRFFESRIRRASFPLLAIKQEGRHTRPHQFRAGLGHAPCLCPFAQCLAVCTALWSLATIGGSADRPPESRRRESRSDHAAQGDALHRVGHNPEPPRRRAQAGRQFVEQGFDQNQSATALSRPVLQAGRGSHDA